MDLEGLALQILCDAGRFSRLRTGDRGNPGGDPETGENRRRETGDSRDVSGGFCSKD